MLETILAERREECEALTQLEQKFEQVGDLLQEMASTQSLLEQKLMFLRLDEANG